MKLILKNNSDDSYSFVNGKVLVSPNSQTDISSDYWADLYKDLDFLKNIRNCNLVVNDGVTDYLHPASEAVIRYLVENLAKEVVTQFEKNDKTLRTVCAWADTNSNGEAEICIPIPGNRWVAYGDAEFASRHFGDYVKIIEITDLDRLIAWQVAFSIDSEATEPVADEVVQSIGYPMYPVMGHYDERGFPEEMPSNAKGTIRSGMAMTFQYGITTAEPIGGYGFMPSNFYLRIVGQKAEGQGLGHKLQVSIDWSVEE